MASRETDIPQYEQDMLAYSPEMQEAAADILLSLNERGIELEPDWSLKQVAEIYADYMEISGSVGRTKPRWGDDAIFAPDERTAQESRVFRKDGYRLPGDHDPLSREQPSRIYPTKDSPLGDHIRYWREEAKMYQEDLGDALGLSHTSIYFYEIGKYEPSYAVLKTLLEACNVPEEASNDLLKCVPKPIALGEHLRFWRERAGLSLKAVAEEINVTPPTLSRYEVGTRIPSAERLKAIIEFIGIPEDEQKKIHATLGGYLRYHRLQQDMTQKELGQKVGKVDSAITYYERDEVIPSPAVLEDLINALSLTELEQENLRAHRDLSCKADIPALSKDPSPGEYIHHYRLQRSMTQHALGGKVGRDGSMISSYEKDEILPSPAMLEGLMKGLLIPEEDQQKMRAKINVLPLDPTPGEYLLHYRLQKNMTQQELGEKVGKTRVAISSYELDESIPPRTALDDLIKALAIPEEDQKKMDDKLESMRKADISPLSPDPTLGEYLRHYHLQKNITREELGQKVGKSSHMITSYEKDEFIPPLAVLDDLTNALSVPEEDREKMRAKREALCKADIPLLGTDPTFAEYLQHFRLQKNMKQQEVADKAGIYSTRMPVYEKGQVHPSPSIREALMEALSLPVEDREKMRAARKTPKPTPHMEGDKTTAHGKPKSKQRGED